jgi:hypothetical protein
VVVEDRIGYIDKTGKLAINPQFSNSGLNLCAFSESLARVKVGEKIGFIDKAGKIVINPQFEGASPFFDGRQQKSAINTALLIKMERSSSIRNLRTHSPSSMVSPPYKSASNMGMLIRKENCHQPAV